MGFPGGASGKESAYQCRKQETRVRSLGQEDPLEEGMATHCSILAWRIPMDRGAWQVTVHSIAKNLTQWKRLGTHHGLYCLQLNVDEEGIEQLCLLNEWLHAPSHCPRKEIHFFYLILQMRKLTLKKVTMLCSGSQEILSKSSAQCHKQFNIQQLCC